MAESAWQDYDLVFCTPIGTPLDPSNTLKQFHQLLASAGLPRRRIHDLRHTCASLLAAQGTPLRTIMEILGHSQISLSSNLYTHIAEAVQAEELNRMDAVLKP